MLKAAIFDLDGTLLDTFDDLYNTMQAVLKHGGYPQISRECVRHLIGNGAREFMRLSLPEGSRDDENVDKNLQIYYDLYKTFAKNAKPYKGIKELLKFLNNKEIKLAILSNKPHHATVDVISHYFYDIDFVEVLGQTDIYLPKPDTASAIYVANKLGFKPSQIAFIGDGDADAMTANSAGFYQASVLWGYRTKEELQSVGAVNFYETTEELKKLFYSL